MLTDSGHIDYENLVADAMREAMRGVIRRIIAHVAETGQLPGEHHFFISFDTNAPGVILSKRLKERYPNEMTVVLQHRFWDLIAHADRFEVKLQFNAIPERLVVPYTSIKVFVDPSVRFGHQFEEPEDIVQANGEVGAPTPPMGPRVVTAADATAPRSERKRSAPRRRAGEGVQTSDPGVVGLPTGPVPVPPATGHVSIASAEAAEIPPVEPVAEASAKVVSLDKFRKK